MDEQNSLLAIFLASTIHEAKNHLSGLASLVETIIQQQASPEIEDAKRYIGLISQSLSQVLMHYRSQHEGYQLHIDEVDLEYFFELFNLRHLPLLKHKKIQLTCDFEDEANIFFDEQMMHNVLDTLIHNAVSEGSSQIKVSGYIENEYYIISVQDNAGGFPESMLEKDLDAFSSTNLSESKTGIGLYLANQILKAHVNNSKTGSIKLENKHLGGCVNLLIP